MAGEHKAGLRLSTAVRDQVAFRLCCLDDLIGADHRARLVWEYVQGLDLSSLYDAVGSVEGEPGRPQTDPAILVAVWLYATLEGVGSARHLARLCETDGAYLWLLGGVSTNHHTLSDFRVAAGAALDAALTQSVAGLVAQGLVSLDAVAVDGVHVRASAGAKSFKRKAKLEELLEQASAHVETLKSELELDPAASQKRVSARRKQAGEDRARRIKSALESAADIAKARTEAAKRQRRKKPSQNARDEKGGPKASFTDPEARRMRMADGGFRPAYNVQFKTEPKHQIVVGCDVITNGSDRGQLGPCADELKRRYGRLPKRLLADGGYDGKADIAALEADGVEIYCPLPENERAQPNDPPGIAAWRERMQSEEGKAVYAERFACERPHADARNRGLVRLTVRSLAKVKAAVLWFAHAANALAMRRLATA